jgi:DNA-binding NarL/FixJ family response regulator
VKKRIMNVFDRYEKRAAQAENDGSDSEQLLEDCYARNKDKLSQAIHRRLYRGQISTNSVIQHVLLSFAGHLRHPDTATMQDDELVRLLFRIANRHCNTANHQTSRAKKRGAVPEQFSPRRRVTIRRTPGASVLDWVEHGDWRERVRDRLVQLGLDERERSLFDLLLAGHTIEAMARETGLREGRVRFRRTQIMRVLKECHGV